MNKEQAAVAAFHRKYGHPVAERPCWLRAARSDLRADLIEEECRELVHALRHGSARGDTAKEAADLVYVVLGTMVEMGIDFGPVFAEVHRSNMSKDPAAKRADGKQLKGDSYTPPDIEAVIRSQPEGAME